MGRSMKLMIAYDGTAQADAAICDLPFAGLPSKGEALVASVADISRSAVESPPELGVLSKYVPSRLLEATFEVSRQEMTEMLKEARKLAIRGGKKLLAKLPGWRVTSRTSAGDPALEILRAADDRKPNLIITGSHRRGTLGRLFLGSISRKIAEKAVCSVRVAHFSPAGLVNPEMRLLAGVSSVQEGVFLVRALHDRVWPPGTQLRLIVACGPETRSIDNRWRATLDGLIGELNSTRLIASVESRTGVLKTSLLDEAKIWNADSIFVLAHPPDGGASLSDTAASLITSAGCTVEVVRKQ